MKGPAAPTPPDPYQTAGAQTNTNIQTALANSHMGMVNQVTPYGSLTYTSSMDAPASRGPAGGPAPAPAPMRISEVQQDRPLTDWERSMVRNNPEWRPQNATTTAFKVGDKTFGSRAEAQAYARSAGGATGGNAVAGSGTMQITGPDGQTYNVPRYTATTTLSPAEAEKLRLTQEAEQSMLRTAGDRARFLEGYLPQTEDMTGAIEARLTDLARERVDPRFAREEEALRARLVNSGIVPGSAAWDREMGRLGETKNDAYTQMLLQGRGQAISEINNPINQIIGLLNGTQVNNPAVSMSAPAKMPTTDVAGLINNEYNQKMGIWNAQNQQRQDLMGGLFGLGAGWLAGR